MAQRLEVKSVRVGERCEINGHACEVVRQARRSTFVKIVEGDLAGQVVQLPRSQAVLCSRPPHRPGEPCPNNPQYSVAQADLDRQKCAGCGYELLSLDAYVDRGGR